MKGQRAKGRGHTRSLPFALCPLPFRLCPLPFRLCPLPFRLCPLPFRLCSSRRAREPRVSLRPRAQRICCSSPSTRCAPITSARTATRARGRRPSTRSRAAARSSSARTPPHRSRSPRTRRCSRAATRPDTERATTAFTCPVPCRRSRRRFTPPGSGRPRSSPRFRSIISSG